MSNSDPEVILASEMARRAAMLAPFLVAVLWALRGADAAAAGAMGLGVVAVNFLVAARSYKWAAAISPTALMGAALGGFLVRLAAVTATVVAANEFLPIDIQVFAWTIISAHLVLLVAETRSIGRVLAEQSPVGIMETR